MAEGKILVVDDNPTNLQVVGDFLNEAGYVASLSKSGEAALKFLETRHVDLVILDVMMPGMNGYETCAQIRKRFPIDDLPIIFLTAREDAKSVIEGFNVGGSDFVCKNFVPEILLARVAVHIRMAQTLRTIREISLTDDLTQTYNRRHAMFTLREWFARCTRYGTHFALIYLDLNDLKRVNDRHGHQAGDLMLRSVVAGIKKVLRESDMLFRMGGDEFMVLCPDTDKEGALICVDRMSESVKAITIVDQTASFAYGIVHSTDNYKQMDDLLHAADDAMYVCKARMKM
jgi:two-component system, cell cycle response regulator